MNIESIDAGSFVIEGKTLVAYHGDDVAVVVPDEVRVIGEGAFRACTNLRIVALPLLAETVEREAFKGCQSLQQVIWQEAAVDEGLVPVLDLSIHKEAFADCSSLQEFSAFCRCLTLFEGAFARCTSLRNVAVGATAYGAIGSTAFDGCTALERVRIEGVYEIEDETFAGLPSLKDVSLCKVCCVGRRAFADCHSLTRVEIRDSLLEICDPFTKMLGDQAFENCSSLAEVSLPAVATYEKGYFGCRSVGVFWGCSSLRRLVVGGVGFSLGGSDDNVADIILDMVSDACLIIRDGVIEGLSEGALEAAYAWEADNYRHWGTYDGLHFDGYDHPSCVILRKGDDYPLYRGLCGVVAVVPSGVAVDSVAEGAFGQLQGVEVRL